MSTTIEQTVNQIYHTYIHQKNVNGKYVCPHEWCKKTYDREESLQRHLARHSTVKDFVCQYCGKAFLRKSECSIHMRIHTGEKPFECSICAKKFARATDLRIHMVYHSDEKPFSCPFAGCSLRFKRKSDAKKHLRIHVKKCNANPQKMNLNKISAFTAVPSSQLRVDSDGLYYHSQQSSYDTSFHSDQHSFWFHSLIVFISFISFLLSFFLNSKLDEFFFIFISIFISVFILKTPQIHNMKIKKWKLYRYIT